MIFFKIQYWFFTVIYRHIHKIPYTYKIYTECISNYIKNIFKWYRLFRIRCYSLWFVTGMFVYSKLKCFTTNVSQKMYHSLYKDNLLFCYQFITGYFEILGNFWWNFDINMSTSWMNGEMRIYHEKYKHMFTNLGYFLSEVSAYVMYFKMVS